MTTDQIILFSLFGGVFVFLLWGRIRYDLVAFTALMLGVAFAATIGGMGSLIGTPPNAIFAAYVSTTYEIDIGFALPQLTIEVLNTGETPPVDIGFGFPPSLPSS